MKTYIDIGAANFNDPILPDVLYYLFEPLREAAELLTEKFSAYPNVKVFQLGLGNKSESRNLYVGKNPECSSLLPLDKKSMERFRKISGFRQVNNELIKIKRLDEVLKKDEVPGPVFVKIDTQGSEFSIIEGFGHFVENIAEIECEVHFEPFYENQKLFHDINKLLHEKGFVFSSFKRVVVENFHLVYADALFSRG